jgi:hypothetical protein
MKLFTIVLLILLIIFMLYLHSNIIEGAPQLPSGTNQASIKTIEDLRDFLEEMYMICMLNPNDNTDTKTPNTICYKISVLATYLYPVLGPYSYWTLDELSPLFGMSTAPTSMVQKAASQTNATPVPVPILISDQDYQLFLELIILGQIIKPFGTAPIKNTGWQTAAIWYKDNQGNAHDTCMENWGDYHLVMILVEQYFNRIQVILGYFHAQTSNSNKTHTGDSPTTKSY